MSDTFADPLWYRRHERFKQLALVFFRVRLNENENSKKKSKNDWTNCNGSGFVVVCVLRSQHLFSHNSFHWFHRQKPHVIIRAEQNTKEGNANQWCQCFGACMRIKRHNIDINDYVLQMRPPSPPPPPITLFLNDFPARLHFTRENERIQFQMCANKRTNCAFMRFCPVQK